jgi:integrase
MKKIKNDKPLQIPILSQAKRILDKYQEQYYLLPRISDQKFNTYIKEAAAEAGITAPVKIMHFKSGTGEETTITKDQLIHAHMTRKTFITLAYKAGLDIESIKAITGIKAEKTLQRYLTIEPETLSDKIKAFSDMIGD